MITAVAVARSQQALPLEWKIAAMKRAVLDMRLALLALTARPAVAS